MDWLLDHKAEFDLLVRDKLKKTVDIEWQAPRLLCIAGDFTKYDSYAVEQINRNIELIRYKSYADGIMLFELVNSISVEESKSGKSKSAKGDVRHKTNEEYYQQATPKFKKLWAHVDDYLLSLGDDVQKKQLKMYMAYRRLKNFVCMEIRPQAGHILLYIKGNYKEIKNPPTFLRDVLNIGHYGTGDVEAKIKTVDEFKQIETLLKSSYEDGVMSS
jgi:predicted transport protein